MRRGEINKSTKSLQSHWKTIYRIKEKNALKTSTLAHYSSPLRARFPALVADYFEKSWYLSEHLINTPWPNFRVSSTNDSHSDVSIQSGDLLIIKRSIKATHGETGIVGEFTVSHISRLNHRFKLIPKNYQSTFHNCDEQRLLIGGCSNPTYSSLWVN